MEQVINQETEAGESTSQSTQTYTLNEIAKYLDINESTLRNWEKKFGDFLTNYRNQYNHRVFSTEDVQIMEKIKYLLESGFFTVPGVKHMLANGGVTPPTQAVQPVGESSAEEKQAEQEYRDKLLIALNSLGSEIHSLRREVREDLRNSLKSDFDHLKLLLFPPEAPKKPWWKLF